jgi:hypothetical protein
VKPAITRALICLLSVGLGAGLFLLSGAHQHTERMLHRWYAGAAITFLTVFVVLVALILRGRFVRARWLFPVCIALACAAAIIAYLGYFSIAEPARMANTLKHWRLHDLQVVLFIVPFISLSWMLGAFVALFYLCLHRLARAAELIGAPQAAESSAT